MGVPGDLPGDINGVPGKEASCCGTGLYYLYP